MASLTGEYVSETYDSLLKVVDNNVLTGTLKDITDGFGNVSALQLSTTDAKVNGDLEVTDNITADSFVKSGGTASQFLKADGSTSEITDSAWSIEGNSGLDSVTNYIGTNDAVDFRVVVDAEDRIVLSTTGDTTIKSNGNNRLVLPDDGANFIYGNSLTLEGYSPYFVVNDLNADNAALTLFSNGVPFTTIGTESDGDLIVIQSNKYGIYPILINATNGNTTIAGTATADSFIKSGGTSNEFLKADGSSDSTVFQNSLIQYNDQTASYTLVLADRSKTIKMNVAGANNLTIPLNATVAFPIGTQIDIIQYGAGQTTIVATGGVTIRSSGGALKLYGQYSAATLQKLATDEWILVGDITA